MVIARPLQKQAKLQLGATPSTPLAKSTPVVEISKHKGRTTSSDSVRSKIPKAPYRRRDESERMPIKGVNAQYLYFQLNRDRIFEKNKGVTYLQSREISAVEWASLDVEGRTKYKDMQAEDKKRYLKELEAYNTKIALTQSTALATSDGYDELLTYSSS
jgi:hypothetical protein